ncbi:unnamed protein product [Rangifer tarandus platyrhynchus]|uniref:Nitric oxide synthase-interacting protein zinc-finger domain-containing protein n=2 Tax=Rangifer tarandus platyrhynchus TaxID=3082113 RepID=A0ABN8YT69_RANTA|nr:unnamed protein product [Rangifer tarandus platyrhynchus]CAI9702368.1 unnamed protein product [Rangifer tarandus platyrhynchus]
MLLSWPRGITSKSYNASIEKAVKSDGQRSLRTHLKKPGKKKEWIMRKMQLQGAGHTYHEEKDTVASGSGTQNIRLGPDTVRDCNCSCRSQQPRPDLNIKAPG